MGQISTPSTNEAAPKAESAFYSVCNSRHFLGFVALLNSLRLMGHTEPIFLIDAGLTPEQRSLIAGHATLVPAPEGAPVLSLTPIGPMKYPAGVAILLDADIIVVRPLTELIEAARNGRLVAVIDAEPNHDRFFFEWRGPLGLGVLRPHPYFNAGQLLVPESLSDRLLPAWNEGHAKVNFQRSRNASANLNDPFHLRDQDVLNAILAARFEPEEIIVVKHRLAPHPPFADLFMLDGDRLVCRYPDGTSPFLLHHVLAKPWLKATGSNIYSSLLSRLLLAPDVTLTLKPEQLPLRL